MGYLGTAVFRDRLARIRRALEEADLAALTVLTPENFLYVSGYFLDVQPWERPVAAVIPREADPFLVLHREVNRLFDDALRGPGAGSGAAGGAMTPPHMNVSETGQELRIEVELPGVSEEDVQVELVGDVLTIHGEKRTEREDVQHRERPGDADHAAPSVTRLRPPQVWLRRTALNVSSASAGSSTTAVCLSANASPSSSPAAAIGGMGCGCCPASGSGEAGATRGRD